MKALVVYESMYGNTRGIAEAIAAGLSEGATVEVFEVGAAPATFDTKVVKPSLPGSAASAAARRLRRKGAQMIAQPMTFNVAGKKGPLVAGELDRARRWGEMLAPQAGRVAA